MWPMERTRLSAKRSEPEARASQLSPEPVHQALAGAVFPPTSGCHKEGPFWRPEGATAGIRIWTGWPGLGYCAAGHLFDHDTSTQR